MSASEEKALLKKIGSNGLQEGVNQDVNTAQAVAKLIGMITVVRLIGLGIAFVIYMFGGKASYDEKISTLAEGDLGYLFLCGVIISLLATWLNMFPTIYKGKVMDGKAGNLRANLFIFKTNHQDGRESPYVVLEEAGGIGQYNRANRSLHHYVENSSGVLVCLLLAGYVFPLPSLVLAALFVAGRVAHQVGYAEGGYGKHAVGFMIHMVVNTVAEMLVALAAVKSFM